MPDITERASKDIYSRPAGRPRSRAADRAILDAALELMARDGYGEMSMAALAEAAGVAKPTIYLRFPGGKPEVATAALAHLRDQRAVKETGDTRIDLIAHLKAFRRGVERPFGMSMIATVLAQEHHMPELLRLFRQNVVRPRRELFRHVFERAHQRGELRTGAAIDAAVNALIGSYYAQYLAGDPFRRDWADRVIDTVLTGILAPTD